MKPKYALAVFALGTILMMFLYKIEILLFALLAICSLFCLAIDKWKYAKRFLIAVIVGGACENIAVMLGGWSYANAHYLFAPLWLPVGWGMAVVLIEHAFPMKSMPKFSKRALAMAFAGAILTSVYSSNEFTVLFGFLAITGILIYKKFYDQTELFTGVMAAILGTAMESLCIITGNWHYAVAFLGTPIWLPLCWFNAFLIMRRITSY